MKMEKPLYIAISPYIMGIAGAGFEPIPNSLLWAIYSDFLNSVQHFVQHRRKEHLNLSVFCFFQSSDNPGKILVNQVIDLLTLCTERLLIYRFEYIIR